MPHKTQTKDQKTPAPPQNKSPMTKKYPSIRNSSVNETGKRKRLNEALQLSIEPYFPVAHS